MYIMMEPNPKKPANMPACEDPAANRKEMLKELTALDFQAVDLALYLDTHPTDRMALYKYNMTVMQADMVRKNYERLYGPLTSYRSPSAYPWQWINNPWPWQKSFNFTLGGKEC